MKTRSEIRHGLLLTFGLFWMVFCIIIYVNQSVFKYQSIKPIYNVQESLNVNVRHQFQDHFGSKCAADEHCEPGYICTHGKCKLVLPCLVNEDCEHGFECIPPYCENYTLSNEVTSNLNTQYAKLENIDTHPNLNSSDRYNTSVKECDCFRNTPLVKNSISPETKNEINFNGRQVSGSFCSLEAQARGDNQNVFSYAYFEGISKRNEYDENDRDFIGGIERNLQSIQKYFPDHLMRLYYHVPPTTEFYEKVCPLTCSVPNLDLCNVEMVPSVGNISNIFPLIWRFLPGMDSQVNSFFVRDLDSEITQREAEVVNQFIDSDKDFHVIRDHPHHGISILGGLWGIKFQNSIIREKFTKSFNKILIDSLLNSPRTNHGPDQVALNKYIWPWAQNYTMAHDSYFCKQYQGLVYPYLSQRLPGKGNFVGAIASNNNSITGSIPLTSQYECPQECRPQNHLDWKHC